MSGVDKTNRLPAKHKKRRAKGRDNRQDQRLKELEKTVFQSLERKSKTVWWGGGTWNVSEQGTVLNNASNVSFFLTKGDGSDDLTGNKVNLLDQTIRFCLHGATGGTEDFYNKVRLIICEPLDSTQSLAIADVLTYCPTPTMVQPAELVMCSPYTVKTSSGKRYRIHYDRVFEMGQTNHSYVGKIKIKFGQSGKVVNFSDSSSTPTDHNLTAMFMSDSGIAPHPKLDINVRSNYFDA